MLTLIINKGRDENLQATPKAKKFKCKGRKMFV